MDSNSDEDCEYYLNPAANQYNITEKIKEANEQLYNGGATRRNSQPKVRFRDQKLVEYDSEEELEIVEQCSIASTSTNKEDPDDEDDGFIDERINQSIESPVPEPVEENREQVEEIEQFDAIETIEMETLNDEAYSKEDFCEDENSQQDELEPTVKPRSKPELAWVDSESIAEPDLKADNADAKNVGKKRLCCLNKYKQKLPMYNGFNSNYGLSKEEIEKRDAIKNSQQRRKDDLCSKRKEQQELTSQVNEEAFAKWLSKKLRDPVDKSNPINMFDYEVSLKYKMRRRKK